MSRISVLSNPATRSVEQIIEATLNQLGFMKRDIEGNVGTIDLTPPIHKRVSELLGHIAEARSECLDLLRELDT